MTWPWRDLFILTEAGISAESGLGTFRDKDVLWTRYDLSEVASLAGYQRDPVKVLDFYNARRSNLETAAPNAAHAALARLQTALASRGANAFLCTQNVDDLHERGGSSQVHHMHGELRKARCGACGVISFATENITIAQRCADCGRVGRMRPHIVWFGEIPFGMDALYGQLDRSDAFISIGTSGSVYPAAGFVDHARTRGLFTLELNLEPSENPHCFDDARYGPASDIVPRWVEDVIAGL
jgi:NAD-dependent deacetylase